MNTNTAANISTNIIIKIKVQSAGYEHGNYAKITLNDQEIGFENYSRGINIGVIDQTTGQPLFCTTFDTHADKNAHLAFTNFIHSLPPGSIVVIAVQDEASFLLSEAAKKVCQSLGSNLINNLKYRNYWAMIGQKGADPKTAQ
ncbi:MAG: interleukin-like EMT inducer domain-containing protein [Microcoleaceae cyanobacterium MO_207.B10]|nr:interleukin-like EMT inducer domain-containing protein [Microcoleaceae cyanobacterium MO_207.B10]